MELKKLVVLLLGLMLVTSSIAQLPCDASFDRHRLTLKIRLSATDDEILRISEDFDIPFNGLKKLLREGDISELTFENWELRKKSGKEITIRKRLLSPELFENIESKFNFWNNINMDRPGYVNQDFVVFGSNPSKLTTFRKNADSTTTVVLKNYEKASQVLLSGNFNNWSTISQPMTKTDSAWVCTIKLKPGKYLYKFIVDGNWKYDLLNDQKERDGYGSYNSVYYETNFQFSLKGFEQAKNVLLSGSFNGWDEKRTKLQKAGSEWKLDVYLRPGTYNYKFIVDGKWITDPANTDKMPNEFNDFNSVISFGEKHTFQLKGFETAKSVAICGTFNDWAKNYFLKRTSDGWAIDLALYPGNYEYKFLVDGNWILDPLAEMCDNSSGIKNNVLAFKPNYVFELKGFENSKSVIVTGTFNNWNESYFQMKKTNGKWQAQVWLPKGKSHYKFIVDGQWITDPANEVKERNEHNTFNSVIWLDAANN